MAIRSLGISLFDPSVADACRLAEELEFLSEAKPDFVEIFPDQLGVILGGRLDPARLGSVKEKLLEREVGYTVHAPLDLNLMDFTAFDRCREVLDACIEFAGSIRAGVVVCHAGQRVGSRDARHSLKHQLAEERRALRDAGDRAAELGITIAVENFYPDLSVARGAVYDYSVWPRELAEQVSAVDHPAVGLCLDVGHAALASEVFGFDYLEECAAVASLVGHLHLHDNLMASNLTGKPPVSEHPVYGLGDLHLPPGRGIIPLRDLFRRVDFVRDPSCCVELSPGSRDQTPEAMRAARELERLAGGVRQPVSA